MELTAAAVVPHPLRPTYLAIVRWTARHGYIVDARRSRLVEARAGHALMSFALLPNKGRTKVALLARGPWALHHFQTELPPPIARARLRRALEEIQAEVPKLVRDYFPLDI